MHVTRLADLTTHAVVAKLSFEGFHRALDMINHEHTLTLVNIQLEQLTAHSISPLLNTLPDMMSALHKRDLKAELSRVIPMRLIQTLGVPTLNGNAPSFPPHILRITSCL